MNKQIEEMAKDIRLNMQIQPNPKEHPSHQLARLMYEDGYRKSTDVAKEIFTEIEDNYADFLFDGHRNIVVLTERDFEELKKKYGSEGADDGLE